MNISVLTALSVLSAIFPLFAALLNYRRLDHILRIAAVFFIISALFDLALVLITAVRWGSKMYLIHLFIAISVIFFGLIYYHAFYAPVLKKITAFLASAVLLTVLLNAFFIQGIRTYPSLSNTVQSVLFTALSLLYFYQLFNRQEFIHIEKQALFWINAGVLIYFSVNIFMFMLYNQLPSQERALYYEIHSVTNIFVNILYAIGLFCKPQKTT